MKMMMKIGVGVLAMGFANVATADILFDFAEVGNDVVMTSSGTFDTTGLLSVGPFSWGGTGIQDTPHDIMGGTAQGSSQVDMGFGFNDGTDYSQWSSSGGNPWSGSDFSPTVTNGGTHGFATYARDGGGGIIPGLGVERADMNGALWSPDQNWIWTNRTLASLNLNVGTYSVSDINTGETITFRIGEIPAPGALTLLGLGGIAATRRRRRV